ncbi:sodium-dependent multivitamin transporter [Ischnura elegans]|uniref:sodium-dependent multivitamin transporter n=1 Tax=Ischnura elegans TaxID=197161 RepID=UPI001ED87E59|nr:sodium-dependent multivitamin transporter [Ischnura elegans]
MADGEEWGLGVVDWVLLGATLAGIEAVGSYAGRKTTKGGQEAKSEYVFGRGGKGGLAAAVASATPTMMLSIARSSTGVRAFVGFPSELYYWGAGMWETVYGIILSLPIIAFVFLPIYYDLGVTSVYQYLELRFRSKSARCLASFTYVIRCIIGLSVTMLTPSIALSGLVGVPLYACILIIAGLTILGSLTGGLRGVVIVDAIQGILLCSVSIVITAVGCYHAGGISEAFSITRERGRLDFFNPSLDPTLRISTMSAVFGTLGSHLVVLGCQQNQVQRFCSMPSKKSVIVALLGDIPLVLVIFSLPWLAGIGIFAALADCDPLKSGKTSRVDDIVPYFVGKYFRAYQGFVGFFLAIIMNSALNITVSNLNAVGTVVWEDFISHIVLFKRVKEKHQLIFIRSIAIALALVIMGLTFAASLLPGIVETSMITNTATGGALLGVFLMAILFPVVNAKGAILGMLVGQVLTFWVAAGALATDTSAVKTPSDILPTSIAGCNASSAFVDPTPISSAFTSPRDFPLGSPGVEPLPTAGSEGASILTYLYAMSFMYYTLFGCAVTMVVGLAVSLLTGSTEEDSFEERMVHPAVVKLTRWLPGRPRVYAPPGSTLEMKSTPPSRKNDAEIKETKEMGYVNGGLEVDH